MPTCLVQELSSKLTNQLADLTSMVRRDLGGEARKKVNTLIITDVHARDIIETFVRDSVMDAREFAWESQLRFYWDRTADDLMIRQCTGQLVHLLSLSSVNASHRNSWCIVSPCKDKDTVGGALHASEVKRGYVGEGACCFRQHCSLFAWCPTHAS